MSNTLLNAVTEQLDKNEARKQKILTDLYITGRLDGKYFGRETKAKSNPVKFYIKSCLYKMRHVADEDIINDCYNEAFCEMYRKNAAKICAMYDESPNKVIATLLHIISLKCFATDPRYGNPKHSLFQSMLHASVIGGAYSVDPVEAFKEASGSVMSPDDLRYYEAQQTNYILESDEGKPCEFETCYGMSVEDILLHLTETERALFYETIGKQPRGKVSADKLAARERLYGRIKEIRNQLIN